MKIGRLTSKVALIPKRSGPLPKQKKRRYQIARSKLVAVVRKMDVGQSFVVEASDTRELQRRLAGVIGPSYKKGTDIYGRRYSLRQIVGEGVRVWRKR